MRLAPMNYEESKLKTLDRFGLKGLEDLKNYQGDLEQLHEEIAKDFALRIGLSLLDEQ